MVNPSKAHTEERTRRLVPPFGFRTTDDLEGRACESGRRVRPSGSVQAFASVALAIICNTAAAAPAPLQVHDDRLTVELFAEQPRIVTPNGIAVDEDGRVFVIENHTPPTARVLHRPFLGSRSCVRGRRRGRARRQTRGVSGGLHSRNGPGVSFRWLALSRHAK